MGTKLRLTCRIADELTIVESVPTGITGWSNRVSPLETAMDRAMYRYAKGGPFAVEDDYNKIVVECPADTVAVGCGCSGQECVQQTQEHRHATDLDGYLLFYCDQKCGQRGRKLKNIKKYSWDKNCLQDCGWRCLSNVSHSTCTTWDDTAAKDGLCKGKTNDDLMVPEMCPWGLGNEENKRNDKAARPPCRLGEWRYDINSGSSPVWRTFGTDMPDGTEGNVSDPFDGNRGCEYRCEGIGGPCADWVYENSVGFNFLPSYDRTRCEYTWPDIVDRHLPITLLAYCVKINTNLNEEAKDLSETLNGVFNAISGAQRVPQKPTTAPPKGNLPPTAAATSAPTALATGAPEPELTETEKKVDNAVEGALKENEKKASNLKNDNATVIYNTIDGIQDLSEPEKTVQMKRKLLGKKKITRIARNGDTDGSRRISKGKAVRVFAR